MNTAIAVEGSSDESFFRPLVLRVLSDIAEMWPGRGFRVAEPLVFRRGPDTWSTLCREFCNSSANLDLAFFHYDGTSRPEREAKKCWEPMLREWERVPGGKPLLQQLVPIREMESWALADLAAVNRLVGRDVGSSRIFEAGYLPKVERLSDPKRTLTDALRSGRRRSDSVHLHLQTLAERASLTKLQSVPSFDEWHTETVAGLRKLGFIESGGKK
ncbi:DUF4276 family protein [Amycolatopsis sp. WAC 04182]|uniref:DUF4276 family protein n=1 Tax=Amycolatopsis sp. WAC 04182 TaxID=2203198 RepID=UPI0013157627|nr:DUF4276 family protein [Amycolatopsis sp. WAC 04182]